MTDKIIAFPTARPLVGPDPVPRSLAVMSLKRAFAATDRALGQLQVTQDLLQ